MNYVKTYIRHKYIFFIKKCVFLLYIDAHIIYEKWFL